MRFIIALFPIVALNFAVSTLGLMGALMALRHSADRGMAIAALVLHILVLGALLVFGVKSVLPWFHLSHCLNEKPQA